MTLFNVANSYSQALEQTRGFHRGKTRVSGRAVRVVGLSVVVLSIFAILGARLSPKKNNLKKVA